MFRWYAIQSKSRREAIAAGLLARAGIGVYLPQAVVQRKADRRPAPEPFFPGYFFAQLDAALGHIRLARYTAGVNRIVGYGDEPAPLPDSLVLTIRQRLERRARQTVTPGFRPGEPLVIVAGPLRNVEAIFDARLSGEGRARVLVSILDRVCRAEIRVEDLRSRPGSVVASSATT